MAVRHRIFRKRSWEEVCEEANAFIDGLDAARVISVSHVSEPPYAVTFVWYHGGGPETEPAGSGGTP